MPVLETARRLRGACGAAGRADRIERIDRVERVRAVLNGTSNFVLGEIERGASLDAAVARARQAGFAEQDASADLSGSDAACKLALLAEAAFGETVPLEHIAHSGIDDTVEVAVRTAAKSGRVLRSVASIERGAQGELEACVALQALTPDDALAAAHGEDNVVQFVTSAGSVETRGAGAGGVPTAFAVLADLDELDRSRRTSDDASSGRAERTSA